MHTAGIAIIGMATVKEPLWDMSRKGVKPKAGMGAASHTGKNLCKLRN